MIFDPFLTLGYVEDINVFVQPSDTVPYWWWWRAVYDCCSLY